MERTEQIKRCATMTNHNIMTLERTIKYLNYLIKDTKDLARVQGFRETRLELEQAIERKTTMEERL